MLLTLGEVAERLGRSYNFVRRLVDEGELPVKLIHGRRYVSEDRLEEWLSAGETVTPRRSRAYSWK